MKTKFVQPSLKLMLGSVAIVALLAASFVTVHASAKAKADRSVFIAGGAPAVPAVAISADDYMVKAKQAAVPRRDRESAAADAALQRSANGTIHHLSKAPRLPRVTCGAGAIRVESTGSPGNDADYASLQAAFAAINAGTHTGDISVGVCADTAETLSAVLNASGSGSASYTSVRVQPSGARTITGAIAAGSPLIDLNGADFVTIDGLNTGGNSLTISNTTASATASTSTIRLIAGAQNNTITNCTVLGSSTSSTATAGGNILISTSTTGANSNNTISNNNLGPAGVNLPTKCVMLLGSAAPNNITGTLIDNNNIFDFFSPTATVAGISVSTNAANPTISNNKIYQTAARTFTTTGLRYNGILASPGSAGFVTITGNRIGFGAADGTGTTTISGLANTINGIQAPSTSTTTATIIQNNLISGFVQTTSTGTTGSGTSFIGISVGATAGFFDIGSGGGNTIGSLDGSSGIVVNDTTTTANTWGFAGIFDFSFHNGDIISNNNVGTITINNGGTGTGAGFRGIRNAQTSGVGTTINNNIIGGTAAGSITDNVVGTYNMYGIDNGTANLTATGNLIRNMSGNAQAAGFISISGIIISALPTGVSTISQNVIHSLSDNAGAANGAIYALYGNFPATANVVERNFVHSLSISGTNLAAQLAGILPVAGSGTYKNNMVRLGIDASGNSIADGFTMYGMFDIAGSNNVYYNSVYVGGGGGASTSNTFAFVSNVTTSTRNYVDNIFWNARSNTGTGKNYAIAVSGTGPNPPGLTSNYNDLYATGTNGFVGLYGGADQPTLAAWQAATGQDANSISADPLFVNATGDATTVNLHIMPGSPVIAMATPITGITTDFDNDLRNPCTPDIGADELTSYSGPPIANVTITKTADAAVVTYGNQAGFVVRLTNTTSNTALGLMVSDNLPGAPGVNWMIDAGATDPGWSVIGTPPNQSLQYSPSTLPGNAMTRVHVISATTVDTCGSTLNNTASFSISNGCPGANSGMASASIMVTGGGGLTTLLNQGFESGLGSWTVVNNSVGGTDPSLVIWTIRPTGYVYSSDTFTGNSGTMFIMANSDAAGSGVTADTSLFSPSFNTGGYTSLMLTYKHYLRWLTNTVATVGVSTDGGGTWTTVQTYNTATVGTAAAFAPASIDLGAYVGLPDVKLRFRYQAGWDWYWAVDDIVVTANGPTQSCPTPAMITSAVSRKTHGGAGTFDIDMPLTGSSGVEDRTNGGTNDYTLVVTFSGNVTVTGTPQAQVTSGTGCVGTGGVCTGNVSVSGAVVTVPLTNIGNAQVINVRINGVNSAADAPATDFDIPMGFLIGDTNGNRSTNAADVAQTKGRTGQPVDGTNFRSDVNANGSINAGDVALCKQYSGTGLPPD